MKSQKSDGLRAFGNSIPQVLQAIERENRWKSKPVGPFGNFVKLKDPVWVDTIESYLGMSLNAFLVENFEDQRILSDILSKFKCESRIFVSPKDEFDFSRGEPSSDHTTVLRVLDVIILIYIKLYLTNSFKSSKTLGL
jgi:chromosome segregation ATPase